MSMSRRVEERQPTLQPAQIRAGARSIDCVVRDMSSRGAKLRVPDAGAVPPQFELIMKDTGKSRPARVRWRRKAEIGIAFMPERRGFGRRLVPPDPAPGGENGTGA